MGNGGTDPEGTWYLPAINELLLIANLDTMITLGNITPPAGYVPLATSGGGGSSCANTGGDCIYWSSSELVGNPTNAWIVNATIGNVGVDYKANSLGVRPVRAFSY
jgi:hypothetical protein